MDADKAYIKKKARRELQKDATNHGEQILEETSRKKQMP